MAATSIQSRVHRCLRHLERLSRTQEGLGSLPASLHLRLEEGERSLAVYRNPGDDPALVIITTSGIYLSNTGSLANIDYDDIESFELLEKDKENAATLRFFLVDGRWMDMPFAGRDGRFRDVFSFHRFFQRVLSDREAMRS